MDEKAVSPAPRESVGLNDPAVGQQGSLRTLCREQATPHSASDLRPALDPPPANPTKNQSLPTDQQPEPAARAHPAAHDVPTEKQPTPQPSAAPAGVVPAQHVLLRALCRKQATPHSASDLRPALDPPPANPTKNQSLPTDQQPEPAARAHPAAHDVPTEKQPTPQPSAAPTIAQSLMTVRDGQASRLTGPQMSSARRAAHSKRT